MFVPFRPTAVIPDGSPTARFGTAVAAPPPLCHNGTMHVLDMLASSAYGDALVGGL